MVRRAEQPSAAAIAGTEDRRQGRLVSQLIRSAPQQRAQLFVCRLRIAKLKLDRLANPRVSTDCNRAVRSIDTGQVSNQKIATAELVAVFVHRQPDQQVPLRPRLL